LTAAASVGFEGQSTSKVGKGGGYDFPAPSSLQQLPSLPMTTLPDLLYFYASWLHSVLIFAYFA